MLFSASNVGSNIARLVDWLLAEATAVTSDLAHEEARRNLAMKRGGQAAGLHEQLMLRVEEVPSALFGLPVSLDDKDRPLLCAAIRAKCTHFATGDAGLRPPVSKTVEQVQVGTCWVWRRCWQAKGR
ncbi:MAG: hypothetical protein IPK26_22395 [Planctomycetes bacterium]|nr:hypothetical protein [Planctomycetota bacterium]